MIKYARVINAETGLCEVGTGTNEKFYKSVGMSEMDVFCSEVDGSWYLAEIAQTEEYKKKDAELQKQKAIQEIKYQLEEIDLKSIRALRAGETERLVELENQAVSLREQLNNL